MKIWDSVYIYKVLTELCLYMSPDSLKKISIVVYVSIESVSMFAFTTSIYFVLVFLTAGFSACNSMAATLLREISKNFNLQWFCKLSKCVVFSIVYFNLVFFLWVNHLRQIQMYYETVEGWLHQFYCLNTLPATA